MSCDPAIYDRLFSQMAWHEDSAQKGPIRFREGLFFNGFATPLDQAVPILRYCQPHEYVGWSTELEETLRKIGRVHFLDCYSRRLAIEHLRPVLERPGALVADFGCSSGWLIEDINTQFPKIGIIGFDSILSGLEWIRGRMPHVPLIQGDLLRNPFPTNGLDGFVTLNVLEHIEDDEAALDQLCRTLAPGGLGFVMVAASPRLYDFYDSLARHFRRYTMDDLRRKLGRVGFQILRSQYLGSSLFIPFAATKKLMHWRFGKEPPEVQWRIMLEEIRRTRSLGVGSVILAAEQWLGKVLPFPFGIRAYALVTK